MAFFDKPMSDIARDVQAGKASARGLCARALESAEGRGGELNAFITVCGESALKRADELDALPPDAKKKMPLCGIPIAVKDNICTEGIKTTCASRILESFVPPYNATVVEALLEAGAVVVGKTNLDEFAMGSSNETSYFGPVRNPRDPRKIPGGSSGGSASAVGAAAVPAALGTDTGGSIRQPSSHCGTVGLKPTYGRVSRYGAVAFASSLDQIGPIASNVRDIGLLLSVISVPDKRDSTCAGRQFADSEDLYNGDVSGLRIGMPKEYFGEGLSNEVRSAITPAADELKRRGASVVEVSLSNVKYAVATYYIIAAAEASSNLLRFSGVGYGFRASGAKTLDGMYSATRAQGFGTEVKRRIMLGTYVLSSGYYDAYYMKAAKVRTLIANDFERALESCDVILAPVSPSPPCNLGESDGDPLRVYLSDIYTVSANLAGIPAMSVPCKVSKGSLPVGAQLMTSKWREDLLLKVGSAIESGVF
ncbi:MAG: Asp-tRNA(Asn)/Glu-tRNA(Gln) amidotransferase subunit GatA [Chitinispirillales bacterium]|jgi:aspartyl-tRNA(Asn)/glutamyl-tRNA(Gln) amidotransferase subunit A|nr:Asp-tRNA(Asn)/Glu-tRNA(Gln) amidotransferase subunit GatA [Chitinispirillales bacterium]